MMIWNRSGSLRNDRRRLGKGEHLMSSRCREPRLEEMLAESIVKAVMDADGVDPRELESELRQTAALMRTTRRPLKEPQVRTAEQA